MQFSGLCHIPVYEEGDALIRNDDSETTSDEEANSKERPLLRTKMYAWLPSWFKWGDSYFGVPAEVLERLKKMEPQGCYAKLEELEKEAARQRTPLAVIASQLRSERSDRTHPESPGTIEDEDDSEEQSRARKLKFYRRFRERVQRQQQQELERKSKKDHEVERLEIPKAYEGRYQPSLHDVCGPPLRHCMPWATLGTLVAAILVPMLGRCFSNCGKDKMLASYPVWMWALFLPWVAGVMLVEWKCFAYIVVPLTGMLGPKRILWWEMRFNRWSVCFLVLSFVTHSEVWSQALLVASAVEASLECRGWKETLAPVWQKAWAESMWYWFKPGGNLLVLAGLAWGFLVLQLLVYVLRAIPLKWFQCGDVGYGCGSEGRGYTVPMCCMRLWHADGIKTLASLNRMVLVLDGQTDYAIKRAYFNLVSDPEQRPFEFFHVLKMDMRFGLFDAIFVQLLQNCAKMQFQTSYWALLLYAGMPLDVRYPALLSLFLTHATSLFQLRKKLVEWLHVREARIKVRQEFGANPNMDLGAWREYDKLVFFQRSVAVVLTMQFLFQIVCGLKFYMSFYCEHALWNFVGGCVQGLPAIGA